MERDRKKLRSANYPIKSGIYFVEKSKRRKTKRKACALGVKTPILKKDYLNYFEFYQLIETNIILWVSNS